MDGWQLLITDEVQKRISEVVLTRPHLEELIKQRLQALLNFPPKRWHRIRFRQGSATFFPEPGQKVRFFGLVDFATTTIEIPHFSVHE